MRASYAELLDFVCYKMIDFFRIKHIKKLESEHTNSTLYTEQIHVSLHPFRVSAVIKIRST